MCCHMLLSTHIRHSLRQMLELKSCLRPIEHAKNLGSSSPNQDPSLAHPERTLEARN
jgi:hypothetical protein